MSICYRNPILTTNLVFSEWNRIFKDPMTTMAAIDRVVHHSVILDMMSIESYRAEVANQHHLRVQQKDVEKPSSAASKGIASEATSAKVIVANGTI